MEGKAGADTIIRMMNDFRTADLIEVGGKKVLAIEDYASSERYSLVDGTIQKIQLPQADVLKFVLEDDCWFCLRPSGTEPKIKFYYGVQSTTSKRSNSLLKDVKEAVNERLHALK